MFRKVAKDNATQLESKQQTKTNHQLNNMIALNSMSKETFQELFLIDEYRTIFIKRSSSTILGDDRESRSNSNVEFDLHSRLKRFSVSES